MADLTSQELAAKLRGERFKPGGPEARRASDPIADTAMVVTLDELRPYELNPRVVRNPRFDDIKASIRERGLEVAPPITRRPGEAHFIIRNGGNTRLSILNELWQETKEQRFFRVSCLFRPWTARGEILALTGHLAENELRGELTFIERALGVEKLRELYSGESGEALTQKELSERLRQDGYPIGQSHISRMQDAIRHLLPSMPKILYGGLGKHQVERLIGLRRGAQRIFEGHAAKQPVAVDFDDLFHDVSAAFDLEPATFNVQRLQDELIGQIATLFGADYDALMLALVDAEAWQKSLLREPAGQPETTPAVAPTARQQTQPPQPASPAPAARPVQKAPRLPAIEERPAAPPTTERALLKPAGELRPAVPKKSHPQLLSDLWEIAPSLCEPQRLRECIGALGREIALEANIASSIEAIKEGIGFVCLRPKSGDPPPESDDIRARATLSLLSSLSSGYIPRQPAVDGACLADGLAPLLHGMVPNPRPPSTFTRLSDEGLLKLFRLIRLARRLVDLESGRPDHADTPCDGR